MKYINKTKRVIFKYYKSLLIAILLLFSLYMIFNSSLESHSQPFFEKNSQPVLVKGHADIFFHGARITHGKIHLMIYRKENHMQSYMVGKIQML